MRHFFIIATLLTCSISTAQKLQPTDALWQQVAAKNKAVAEAFIEGDANKMAGNYIETATLMPEHSTTRNGSNGIRQYFTDWLGQVKVNSYTKTIYEITNLDGYALEIGTFTQNFTLTGHKPYEYKGKYMVLWRTSNKLETSPFIAAEIWGANDYVNDADFPDIKDGPKPVGVPSKNKKLEEEIMGRNQLIAKLVTERKGAEHATLFLPDAIYMTYYTPMLVGIEPITNYFTGHEKPGTLKIDAIAITTDGITETKGGLIIEFGSYKVDWSDGDTKGTVTGKSINVWKRGKNKTLMLYRQMVNHD